LGAGARLSDYLSASLLARVYPAAMIGKILDEHGCNSKRVRSLPQTTPFAVRKSQPVSCAQHPNKFLAATGFTAPHTGKEDIGKKRLTKQYLSRTPKAIFSKSQNSAMLVISI